MKPGKFFDDPRKRSILFASAVSLAAAGLGVLFYANQVEPRRYRLDFLKVDTGVPGCEPECPEKGELGLTEERKLRLRILHLSDLHLCAPESHKLDFLDRATDSQYDLIVISGDIFEDSSGFPYAGKIISRPPRLGTYAVLGNHDHYAYGLFHRTVGKIARKWRFPATTRDVRPFVRALEEVGINVLSNSAARVPDSNLHIVGIDYLGISDSALSALVSQAAGNDLVLALMHVPDGLNRLSRAGVHMAFCGHTHGGQVRIPFFGPITTDSELPRREASGLIWRGETAIHISRGIGADPRTNVRLFCPPHATVIEVCHRF